MSEGEAQFWPVMQGKLKHTVKQVRLEDINVNRALLRDGDIIGRAQG